MFWDAGTCAPVFDIPTISGYYAQMAGVLAGFAFTALVVLMTPTQVEERKEQGQARDNGILLTLFVAFIALILATLAYSVLAGDDSAQARDNTYTAELVDGIPFALAIIMLLHGVALLMESGNLHPLAVWSSRAMSVVGAPLLAFRYLSTATIDTQMARFSGAASACARGQLPGYTTLLEIILVIASTTALVPRLRFHPLQRRIQKYQGIGPLVVLVTSVVVTSVVGGSILSTPGYLFSVAALNWYVIGIFVLLLGLSVTLAYGYRTLPARPHADEHHNVHASPQRTTNGPNPLETGTVSEDTI